MVKINRNLLKEINISLAGYFNAFYMWIVWVIFAYKKRNLFSSIWSQTKTIGKLKKNQLQISINDNKSEKEQSIMGQFAYGLLGSYCAFVIFTQSSILLSI